MFKSLQNKLLLMNMAITSLVILGAFCAVYLTTHHNIRKENESRLKEMTGASMTFHASERIGDPPDGGEPMHTYGIRSVNANDYSPSFTLQLSKDGDILLIDTFYDLPGEVYAEAASLAQKDGHNARADFYGRQWLYSASPYTVAIIGPDGHVTEAQDGSYSVSFYDITDSQKTLRDLLFTFLAVGIAVLIVVFWISLYFARRSIRPVEEAWERQRQFIADASHELKTPLAMITANYDALLANEEETIKSQRQWLGYMRAGTDRMARLINRLLSLAAMESRERAFESLPFDLSEKLHEMIGAMEIMGRGKQLTLIRSIEPGVLLRADAELIEEIFTVLFENAVQYANSGGTIEVSLARGNHAALCTVRNTGKGIKKEDLPKIFDRFYRADPSRYAENGGTGLGLAIARAAAERMGGTITAESIENEWTAFRFSIGGVLEGGA